MKTFEDIINLMSSNGSESSSLEQHCSAMRMDDLYNWTSNRLSYTVPNFTKER
jgi:hypothetical protein